MTGNSGAIQYDSRIRVMQIALNSSDLVSSLRFYAEIFGFANAGAQAVWGDVLAVQGLEKSARTIVWWLVGRQQSFQFEVFHHTVPKQRPLPDDWKPSDLGWTRMGIATPRFDDVLQSLATWDVKPISEPIEVDGGRRVAIRDPFAGIIVEIMEETAGMPGGIRQRHFDLDPYLVYVTSSVSDIDEARRFYGELIGLTIEESQRLHLPEHEALWGLEGARTKSFLAPAGDILLEIVQYIDPPGRPRPEDYRISDQGIMNVGLRSNDLSVIQGAIDRVSADGTPPNAIASGPQFLGTYILASDREVELLGCPDEFDPELGFVPSSPFMGLSSGDSGLKIELTGRR